MARLHHSNLRCSLKSAPFNQTHHICAPKLWVGLIGNSVGLHGKLLLEEEEDVCFCLNDLLSMIHISTVWLVFMFAETKETHKKHSF